MRAVKFGLILLALSVCIGNYVYLNTQIDKVRNLPREADDSYHFIIKASNIKKCLFNECQGLESVYAQTQNKTDDAALNFIKDRQAHRILLSYHPLYSLGLLAAKTPNVSYEVAQARLHIAIIVIASISMAFFLHTFFGTLTTVAILLTPLFAQANQHGLHFPTPYVLALSFAWLTLGLWRRQIPYRSGLTILLLLGSCASHPVGIVLSGGVLVFIGLYEKQRFTKAIVVMTGAVVCIMSGFYIKSIQFTHRAISVSDVYQENSTSRAIARNIIYIAKLIEKEIVYSPILLYSLPLIFILGIACRKIIKQKLLRLPRHQICLVIMLSTLLLVSILYPVSHTSILYRIWPLFVATFLAFYYGTCFLVIKKSYTYLQKNHRNIVKPIYFLMGIFCVITLFHTYQRFKQIIYINAYSNNSSFSIQQLIKLETLREKNEPVVLYGKNEAFLYFFLANGGEKKPLYIDWLNPKYELSEIRFMVSQSPASESWPLKIKAPTHSSIGPVRRSGDLMIEHNDTLKIHPYTGIAVNKVQLYLQTYDDEIELQTDWGIQKLKHHNGWVTLQLPDFTQKVITVTIKRNKKPVRLLGVRTNSHTYTRWPWNQASIELHGKEIDFDKQTLVPDKCHALDIIDDTSSVIVVKVNCKQN